MNKLVLAAMRCSLLFLVPSVTYAISAQWDLDPVSGDWNTAANWTPMGVPDGPADIATFGLSHTTDVSISADTEVNGITFSAAATNPYTITASLGFGKLTISGVGIVNNSGIAQNFVNNGGNFGGQISFTNNATAGSSTVFTNNQGGNLLGGSMFFFDTSSAGSATLINHGGFPGGFTAFRDSSTAGNATIVNNGTPATGSPATTGFGETASAGQATITNKGGVGAGAGIGGFTGFADNSTAAFATIINDAGVISGARGGVTIFGGNATAANATIINNGGTVSGAHGGFTDFFFEATAGNGTFINNGGLVSGADGGSTIFTGGSTAGSSTLFANGGSNGGEGGMISFESNSTGGTSRIEVFGNGFLDISNHVFRHLGVTVGSIEGDGNVFLGDNTLQVGSNNLSTEFSGEIQDGGQIPDTGGSLTKIGTGTLTLSGTNTYTGNTNVRDGVLQVDGSINSNTTVRGRGTLAGTGTINGNVTSSGTLAGTGTINGNVMNNGKVSPGDSPGVLSVVHNYTQAQYATLMIQIAGANAGQFGVLNVLGTANLSGHLDPVLLNGFVPTVGQSFTFLNYGAVNGTLFMFNPNIDNEPAHWEVGYFPTYAILTVVTGNVPVPDQGSTFLLLTLGLLGLVTYRRQLLPGQP